ncbi:MAG TPA: TIGR03016 family PEP-CTERM system-associated outer membrane protein [Casimicrobiaceae bacterium]|nr:TIGR03016 family PEP-CTERM system-associated outer membrane protein [Casimicrobiaceae bacterium]
MPPTCAGLRACAALALAANAPLAMAQYAPITGGAQGVPGTGVEAAAPGAATGAQAGAGRNWLLVPSIDALFTFTDNVNLTSTDRKYDFVTQLTPALRFSEKTAHTKLEASIQAPILLYARTGDQNNTVQPVADVRGVAELVERLFYVETVLSVSQQYFSPFGPQPTDLVNATSNRYTAQSYRVSPVLKGDGPGGLSYQVRDDNIWADQSNTSFAAQRSYTNELDGKLTQEARPVGWQLEYDRADTKFTDVTALRSEIERASALFRQDATLEWSIDAGYETNNYAGPSNSAPIYGIGVRWRPTDRTTAEANYEHRFFGGSYHVTLDHRTPLTVWSLRASRDITTYPQQLAALTGGEDVSGLLNRLFASRLTDPAQRQVFVDQFIRERGLPSALAGPLALFSEQVTLQQIVEARVGLVGARNSVFGTLYRSRSEAVSNSQTVLSDLLLAQQNNTQTGGNVVWTQRLTPLYTLSTRLDYTRTVENGAGADRARQLVLTTSVSTPLSPFTRAMIGARWQRLWSNVGNDYREAAAFVGVNHVFR